VRTLKTFQGTHILGASRGLLCDSYAVLLFGSHCIHSDAAAALLAFCPALQVLSYIAYYYYHAIRFTSPSYAALCAPVAINTRRSVLVQTRLRLSNSDHLHRSTAGYAFVFIVVNSAMQRQR